MDVNDMRMGVMVLGLVLFLGIWVWAWSSRRRAAFEEAANLPFIDDEAEVTAPAGASGQRAEGGAAAVRRSRAGDTA